MTNADTSATGGYLSPAATSPPAEDGGLDAQFQSLVVGITGLDGDLVRPRWQSVVPKQLPLGTDWCAIGVASITPDDNAAIVHQSTAGRGANNGIGDDQLQRHEAIEVRATFYGPNAFGNAATLRDGLYIAQNREVLMSQGIAFIASDRVTAMPELVNQNWLRRADIVIHFRRIVIRTYAVLDVASVAGTIVPSEGTPEVAFNTPD